MFTNKCMTPLF